MPKKFDREPVAWITRGGKHVPIFENEDNSGKEIEAKDIKVGDTFYSGKTIQRVAKIASVTDKAITFYTDRIYPDFYPGAFQRKQLKTKIKILKK